MKFTLSLLAAVALTACAAETEVDTTKEAVQTTVDTKAPKAAKVSLAIEGMT